MDKEWMKKHIDTIFILGGILGSVLWMNGKINQLQQDMSSMKTDIAVVKTVLVMKEIMPKELVTKDKQFIVNAK